MSAMVEMLLPAGECVKVVPSRQLLHPKLDSEDVYYKCLMVLDCKGVGAADAISSLIDEDMIDNDGFEHLENNIYLVNGEERECVVIKKDTRKAHVYFFNYEEEHAGHWGRCVPNEGFACGIVDTDIWLKVLETKTSKDITVTRSYSMDCLQEWDCGEDTSLLTEEELTMRNLGLPLTFGQDSKDFRRINDEAVLEDSCIVERDYDKELADMSSSTERMSISRANSREERPLTAQEVMESFVKDHESADFDEGKYSDYESAIDDDGADESNEYHDSKDALDVTSIESDVHFTEGMSLDELPQNSISIVDFDKFWTENGPRIIDSLWKDKFGEYMTSDETYVTSEENSEPVEATVCNIVIMKESGQDGGEYADEWSKLWENHIWEVYSMYLNRLVTEDELQLVQLSKSGDTSSLTVGSFEGDGDTARITEVSGSCGNTEKDFGEGSHRENVNDSEERKRPLSPSDFGLSYDKELSIEKHYVKNHRLKKVRRESHFHKRDPNATSADALEVHEGPKDVRLAKYWTQRYRLFSKFDKGVQLDDESWYSVTPEKIAAHIAARICRKRGRGQSLIMDGFCGVGGTTIQLAQRCGLLLAVDIDPKKVNMARHNAAIYNVDHKVDFVIADMTRFVPRIEMDAVFFSPPWGGPDYKERQAFDLSEMVVDTRHVFRMYKEMVTPNIAILVPRNTKVNQLSELGRVEVEQNLLNKKIKTITAYYGSLVCR